MGTHRRHLFVLLFVLGLIAASATVIASKGTQLGLDLRGGTELVYEARPTGPNQTIDDSDIDRSLEIIRERVDTFGVAEPEISRLGQTQISVGLPDVTNAGRAQAQVGTTAQLYFYDWEPNLVGPAHAIEINPLSPPEDALAAVSEEWREAGRNPNEPLNQGLVASGAEPTAWEAAQLAAEQPPVVDCPDCSAPARYYLFKRQAPHDLIAGPEIKRGDLFVSPTGERRPRNALVVKVPQGTLVVSERPFDPSSGEPVEDAEPGWYAMRDRPALSGTDITNPEQQYDPNTNQPNVTFGFTDEGREAFHAVTRKIAFRGQSRAIGSVDPQTADAISGHFAIVLDNEVVSRPIINFQENPDGIDGRTGAQISGLGLQEAQDLANLLRIGALPVNLKLISQSQVSATLGQQALDEGLRAGIAGLIVVILFLLLYYRFLGLVASLALGAYGVLFFALIKLVPITLTLPGIAGLILTIGVAADSNIVIFERIKEEARAGRSMASAIAAGYRRGIATIIDANVITLLTAFILFVLATAGVKGFAFTLGVGTIVSLLTAVVFTQALLGSMSRAQFLRSPSVLGAGERHLRWHFDFIGASRWFFSMSGVILLVGTMALATEQLNLGIDFESGTRIKVGLEQRVDDTEVNTVLSRAGITAEEVQQVSDPVLGENTFQIQSRTLQPDQVQRAEEALSEGFGVQQDGFESQSVGPTFGEQVARSAAYAIVFSLLLIAAYVAFRFDPKFAVPVLIALVHDILITAGVYSLTGREVSSATVAAFLTILGYSMYDTIIVFDRIRENLPRMPRAAFSQVVNRSMSEVMTRSLATGFCTLIGVVSLLLFGGATLTDFAFAILVGVASGAYSSIFIASPVLTAWKEREPAYQRRRARIEEVMGFVPAFAEQVEVARVGEEAEEEEREARPARRARPAVIPAEVPRAAAPAEPAVAEEVPAAPEVEAPPEPAAPPEPVAPVDRVGADGSGAGAAEAASGKQSAAKRRRQRQRRRKHGRHR